MVVTSKYLDNIKLSIKRWYRRSNQISICRYRFKIKKIILKFLTRFFIYTNWKINVHLTSVSYRIKLLCRYNFYFSKNKNIKNNFTLLKTEIIHLVCCLTFWTGRFSLISSKSHRSLNNFGKGWCHHQSCSPMRIRVS